MLVFRQIFIYGFLFLLYVNDHKSKYRKLSNQVFGSDLIYPQDYGTIPRQDNVLIIFFYGGLV